MADLEIGNVEAYVRELVAEFFGSETERDRDSNRGSLANNSSDMPVSTKGNLVNNTGHPGEGSK